MKINYPYVTILLYFSDGLLDNIKMVKISSTYAIIVTVLDWMQSGYFLRQATENHHLMVLVDLSRGKLREGACSAH